MRRVKHHSGPVDPIEILSDLAADESVPPSVRVRACAELLAVRKECRQSSPTAAETALDALNARTADMAARRRAD